MNNRRGFVLRACVLLTLIASAFAVKIGDPAPGFTIVDSNGKQQHLSDYKGKYVVLEWHNQGCPYTKKHYESGNMQRLQKEWTGKGVVWLTVISSAPGMQGFVTPTQENEYLKTMNAVPLQCSWIWAALWGISMTQKQRRTCSLSVPVERCFTTAPLTITRPQTKMTFQIPKTTFLLRYRKPWQASR